MIVTIFKIGMICHLYISSTLEIPNSDQTFNEFLIPEEFRPVFNISFGSPGRTSGTIYGSDLWSINMGTGRIALTCESHGFSERYGSISYISNDLTPDDEYLYN